MTNRRGFLFGTMGLSAACTVVGLMRLKRHKDTPPPPAKPANWSESVNEAIRQYMEEQKANELRNRRLMVMLKKRGRIA
jgi:hypothetical protein